MNVLILGGSGFIGSALSKVLVKRGDTVILSSKDPYISQYPYLNVKYIVWDGFSKEVLVQGIEEVDVVVNLVGENIASKRWTSQQKKKIQESRVITGKILMDALHTVKKRPSVLIQASAVGYYGVWTSLDTAPECTEKNFLGKGFLANTVAQWEASTANTESLGIRRCVIRTAPVLGPYGGVLKKMLPFFSLGLGSILGTGKQPFPWIHIDDEVAAIIHLIDNSTLSGYFNLVAPEYITAEKFAKTLGQVLNRVVFLRIPEFMLRFGLGEMADEILLSGQKAYPEALLNSGFTFKYSSIIRALYAILK